MHAWVIVKRPLQHSKGKKYLETIIKALYCDLAHYTWHNILLVVHWLSRMSYFVLPAKKPFHGKIFSASLFFFLKVIVFFPVKMELGNYVSGTEGLVQTAWGLMVCIQCSWVWNPKCFFGGWVCCRQSGNFTSSSGRAPHESWGAEGPSCFLNTSSSQSSLGAAGSNPSPRLSQCLYLRS